MNPFARSLAPGLLVAALLGPASTGCSASSASSHGALSPTAQKWLERARESYKNGDIDDARDAVQSALSAAPDNVDVRTLAGRIHLARLEYAETLRVLQGVDTPDAYGLRGRAHWYADDIDAAADDLEALTRDPSVKDEWAKAISRLARQGAARKPFQISGGLLAPVPMPRVRGTHLVVSVEINGEPALALVATSKGEVILDSATRKEPSWVQLRFGERIEIRDVPALVEDLSGISKEVGAPIKALLGINLLRRLHVTFDFGGEQFVVRTKEPPPPPNATRLPVYYALGGAMIVRAGLKQGATQLSPMLVNSLLPVPVALDEPALREAGVDPAALSPMPGGGGRMGKMPFLKVGAFDIPEIPAMVGPSFSDIRAATGIDIDGAIGSGLLAAFRVTLADAGRALWLEDLPPELIEMLNRSATPPSQAPAPPSAPGLAPPGGATTPTPPAPAPGGGAPSQPKPPAGK